MQKQKIIIIGAGIVGLATAYHLLKQVMQNVIVLEQATVGHARAASGGLSRLLRFEYGDEAFYSEMVRLSQKRWQSLEQASKKRLYTPTGILTLGNEDDNFSKNSYSVLRNLGHAPEQLTRLSCARRFPQFNTKKYDTFVYNRDSGMLHVSRIVKTLRAYILEMGGEIHENQRVVEIHHEHPLKPIRLQLATEDEMVADRVVVAIGSWVHRLLGDFKLPVRLTRQYLLYFANLPESLFGLSAFPAFMADDLYGFPIHSTCAGGEGPRWLKAASHSFGAHADPDEVSDIRGTQPIEQIVIRLHNLLPALQQAELVHTEACIYDVSQDENFILDHIPDDKRIIFATGLSGHAFKFGLLLGEMLGSLVCETEPVVPLEHFRLTRFCHQWQHSFA